MGEGNGGNILQYAYLLAISKKNRNVFPLSLLRNRIMRASRVLHFGGVRGFGGLRMGKGI